MIERKFVAQKFKEHHIQEFMAKTLSKAGYSHTEIRNTPLGEKITIYTTRPGIVVGKGGENIKKITAVLKKRFKLENPQIEIGEVENPLLDAQYVVDKIAYNIERFGPKRFKSIGYRMLQDIMSAGAKGAEVVITGKVPSARARGWRFSAGYLKKSGDIAVSKIKHAKVNVNLKMGALGVKVSIMTPDIELPDKIHFKTVQSEKELQPVVQEMKEEKITLEQQEREAAEKVMKGEGKKKTTRKATKKKSEKRAEEKKAGKKERGAKENGNTEEK